MLKTNKMNRNLEKEKAFYAKPFNFSYSSINKMLFSPTLFYRDYVLGEREIRTDKHLIEGKLVHCLVFEPEKLKEIFSIVPGKIPSDNIKRILKSIKDAGFNNNNDLNKLDSVILEVLKIENLYQSFKEDAKRLEKIQTNENQIYYEFMCTTKKDIIDNDTLQKCTEQAETIKGTESVMKLFNKNVTDFELDTLEVYKEKRLECKLQNYKFGLKGIIDYYDIDHDKKIITIVDLKTSSKTLSDFNETLEYYNYWLQAAIYVQLILSNGDEKCDNYKILFNFVLIDKYNQVYTFPVSKDTMSSWTKALIAILIKVEYHYNEKKYDLPYEFSNNLVYL